MGPSSTGEFSLCLLISFLGLVAAEGPRVQIENGTLEGSLMRTRLGREFFSFRGIPYALPPLGELRFEPPKPAASWKGVRPALEDKAICTQRNIYIHQEEIIGAEDCLYLNVYTPELPSKDKLRFRGGLPVMVWLHGGGWIAGSGNSDFYGPKFLLDHDVVLVSANYRLGPLGFLSTEDLVCPGNQGMKDQSQVLRWIQENIAAFAGDPNSVTIVGESAGGASVNYHMISPLSKGLFHRGIAQSGTVFCPWTLTRPGIARKHTEILAERLNCPHKDSQALMDCLRKKDAAEIIGTDRAFQVFDYDPMIPFRPVIELEHPAAFLTEDPAVSMMHGRLADIAWMTGITSEEGSLRVAGLYGRSAGKFARELEERFEEIAPVTLFYEDTCPKEQQGEVSRRIREFYLGDRRIDNSTRFDVIDMYSDSWFIHGAHTAVRHHLRTQSSPVYYYMFAYRGSASFSRIFGDPAENYGVSHADDLQYLFPVGEGLFPDVPLNAEDHRMIDLLTSLWFNFAKHGNPTPTVTKTVPVKWKPVQTEKLEYLYIGKDRISMKDNLLPKRIAFWDSLPIRPDLTENLRNYHTPKDEL